MSKYKIIDPENNVLDVDSLADFAKKHDLDRKALSKVVQGKQSIHKGYHVFKSDTKNLQKKIKDITNVSVMLAFYFGDKIEKIDTLAEYCVRCNLKYGNILNAIEKKKHYFARRYFFAENTSETYIKEYIAEHKAYRIEQIHREDIKSVDWIRKREQKLWNELEEFDKMDIAY